MIILNKSLTYCSNIFKEKFFFDLLLKLEIYTKELKIKFKKKYIGIGLCLSNKLVNEILNENKLNYFKIWLKKNNLYVSSINGFVYKTFHKKKIKSNIYYPDWTNKNRVFYTKKIITMLLKLNVNINDYSISTMPISFKKWILNKNKKYIYFKSSLNIINILKYLMYVYKKYKKKIHLDIEPEPACLIESFNDFLFFFNNWLKPTFKINISDKIFFISFSHLYRHINLCYDICHFSVNFEDHNNIINTLKNNKIRIGKIQVSAALEFFSSKINITAILKSLNFLKKSQFLHQNTLFLEKNKRIFKYIDIFNIFNNIPLNSYIRIHCHVPLYLNFYNNKNLKTTSKETITVLINILKKIKVKHIEIETYTYDMLSKKNKKYSIFKEYSFVINIINNVTYD